MRKCLVCDSDYREKIEQKILEANGAIGVLESISEEYDIPVEELQRHMLFHAENGDSLVRQIKMREADMLAAATEDYMSTLKIVGARIRRKAQDSDEILFERCLTKPVVELYTGCGAELRGNIKTLADINQQLNGPKDDGSAGLLALAEALRGSRVE